MNKLRLDVENVEVLSFPTTAKAEAPVAALGTVFDVSRCGYSCQGTSVCCETV